MALALVGEGARPSGRTRADRRSERRARAAAGARAASTTGRPRGERPRSGLASYVWEPAAGFDADEARNDFDDNGAVRLRAASARVEADGAGVAGSDRADVDRRTGHDDAVGLTVGVVVRAGGGACVVA